MPRTRHCPAPWSPARAGTSLPSHGRIRSPEGGACANPRRHAMYAITGITGNVGGAAADALLAAGLPVRAVLRDPAKADAWAARGCEIAFADIDDAEGLASALAGVEAAFVMVPPNFDPAPHFAEARHSAGVLSRALAAARDRKSTRLNSSHVEISYAVFCLK